MRSVSKSLPKALSGHRLMLAVIVTALALIVPVASASAYTMHLKAPNHSPKAGKKWPIKITTKPKVNGRVVYKFVFNGSVVASRPGNKVRRGRYHDKLKFPKRAVGIPLTLRIILKSHRGIAHIDWKVKVRG